MEKRLKDELTRRLRAQLRAAVQHQMSPSASSGSISRNGDTVDPMDVPPAMSLTVAKFQRAVRKAVPKKMTLLEAVEKLMIREQANKRRLQKKNRWQKIVKKHLLGKDKNKLDLNYIVKVVTMQEKLAQIFGEKRNLGTQYREIGINIWSNEFLEQKRNYLTDNGKHLGFCFDFNLGQMELQNIDKLFEENLSKLSFY